MLMSGFLMAWHWELNPPEEMPSLQRAKGFWIRRFFRIAPLYYPLLLISLWLTPKHLLAENSLLSAYPLPWATELKSYVSPTDYSVSLASVLSHLTFTFGMLPQFSNNNILPDWSISLEMQFYALFPFLVIWLRRRTIVAFCLLSIALSVAANRLFGLYLFAGPLGSFPQPSFIPFKLHVFVAGMALGWLAAHRAEKSGRYLYYVAFALPLLFLPKLVVLGALAIAAVIMIDIAPFRLVAKILGSRPFRFLGDVSYPVYLFHMLPLYFFLNVLLDHGFFDGTTPVIRFALVAILYTPLVLLCGYFLHQFIEVPGIELGRRMIKREKRAVINT